MRTVLAGIFILFYSLAFAQRECASAAYYHLEVFRTPSFTSKITQIERSTLQQITTKTSDESAPAVVRIPVVVHVLYKNADENISEQQINSQIDALNRDFRRTNADTVNTPSRFKLMAADVQIEFALATADPMGRPTNGIVRKPTTVIRWSMDDRIKFSSQGGDDAWDTRFYLNFWVGDLGSVLGYSSIPGASIEKDGVVINRIAFGTVNTTAPYHLGRTATHEVGHWLGLKHLWGDDYCGDDLVGDTPMQGNFTSGCPTGFRSSCSNGDLGDMYMNYMDFTDDQCMNLFTTGQKDRMLSLMIPGAPRYLLLSSKGLQPPWLSEAPVEPRVNSNFKLYPNPTTGQLVLDFEFNTDWIGKTVSIISVQGMTISTILVTSKNMRIDVQRLKPGLYFIKGDDGKEKIRERFIKL